MPFSAGETDEGRRLIGADRATWVRLLVALGLAVAAAAFPHVGWTSAEFTDSHSSTGVVQTAPDFDPGAPPAVDDAPTAPTDEPSAPEDPPGTDG
ncbi:hypothetical protein [Cellulomonas sp. PhB150]|uniref:hypothetical protein n=1 Tax=Cellulomonas sp. PhB150 TaxID=2485188 RepID=UPI000F475CC9|nr:hypothetical protein [Cellulomonas sp. PhB150]ROS31684.1 hypothetical protein EDF34_1347 [Cellulomonas sp. PhB150]